MPVPGYVRLAYCVSYETIVHSLPHFEELASRIPLIRADYDRKGKKMTNMRKKISGTVVPYVPGEQPQRRCYQAEYQ